MLLRPTPTAPAQPRRRPPAQPRTAHHRGHPRPPRPDHPRVPRTQTSRRQDQERRAPLPQAPPRPPLLAATRRAAAPSTAGRHSRARSRAGRAPAAHHPRTPRPPSRARSHDHRAQPDDLHHLAASSPTSAHPQPATSRRAPPVSSAQPQNEAITTDADLAQAKRRVLSPSAALDQPAATDNTPQHAPSQRPSRRITLTRNPQTANLP